MSHQGYPGYQPPYGGQQGYPGAGAHHGLPSQPGFPSPAGGPPGQYGGSPGPYNAPPPGQYNAPPGPPQGHAPQAAGASDIDTTGSADGVQYRIAYRDSNSLLSLRLSPGADIKAKPGSMVAMDGSVQIKGKVKFSFKKLVTGGEMSESIFSGPGEVLLAPETWGDIAALVVDGTTTWRTGKHSFLAATAGVVRAHKSQGLGKGLFSGEGLFVEEVSGRGILFVQSLGAVFQRQLRPGEELIVDNGHLVAWSAQYKVERVQAGGMMSAAHTDEGLVCRFTGPGIVYIQTRNPETLIGWIDAQLPSRG
ncbi:DUF124-domain-containing protein [Trametopsis cervina]|nr:DUF124-domain-containing protein [Trametopsis cervina]